MASLAPVTVVTWLNPPLQSDFVVGDMIRWYASFTLLSTPGVVVDPDIVLFTYTIPPVTTTPQVATTVKDQSGLYHYDLVPAVPGKFLLNVQPQGNPGAVNIGHAEIRINVFPTGL